MVALVWAVMPDGSRTVLFAAPPGFDVEGWVRSRAAALRLLGVREVVLDVLPVPPA